MEHIRKILVDIESNIEQLRDEIKLKAHLGKAEAKDELEKLEEKWKQLQEKYQPVANEIGTTAEKAAVGLTAAANEIKEGFKRIKEML